MSLFSVKGLNFRRNGKQILQNVSFDIHSGEILSILGSNGAGKTTLLKCALGLLDPNEGERFFLQKPLKSYGKHLWQQIGYVAQAKHNILNLKVLDMVTLGFNPAVRFHPKPFQKQKAKKILESLCITHLEDKHCCELSGGELQMVLFARALVCEPKLLVLDEPESNLDFANQKIILDMLKRLSKNGCAIIINTHFPSHALYLSHKALLINKIDSNLDSSKSNVIFGNSQEVLTQEHLSALYKVPLYINSEAHSKFNDGYIFYI